MDSRSKLISREDLIKRWDDCSYSFLTSLEGKGILQRVPNFGGLVRYRLEDVEEIETARGDGDIPTPHERAFYERKIKAQEQEIRRWRERFEALKGAILEGMDV